MKKLTYGQLHGLIVNDNTNINSMIRNYISESANAAVVAVYDDSLILVDTINEEFYTCKYHYNPDALSVILEGYNKIELEEDDTSSLKVAVKDYLVSEDVNSKELLNSYLNSISKSKNAVESIVAESVADKDYTNTADFEELSYINESFEELRESDFFHDYQERLITHPMNNVLVLDWVNPVAFSLYDSTEPVKYINTKSKEKAKKICASKKFKKECCAACKQFAENVEDGGDMLIEMFSKNISLFTLNDTELKEAISKAIISDKELSGEYKQITEAVLHFIKNDEGFTYLREAIDIDDTGDDKSDEEKKSDSEAPAEDGEEKKDDDGEDKKDDKARELTDEDREKLVDALNTVVDKVSDEKIKKMAQDLLDKFDVEDTDTTDVEAVKEAVRFLSIAF